MSKPKRNRPNRSNTPVAWLVISGVLLIIAAGIWLAVAAQSPGATARAISQLSTEDFHSLAFSPTEPETIFFGHHQGLLISRNGGKNWEPTALANVDAMALALPRANPQLIYAAGHDVFYKSTNAGQSWQAIETDLPSLDIHGFTVDPNDPTHLFANIAEMGIFSSKDGGATWTKLSSSVPLSTFNLAAENSQTLYAAATKEGLWRSQDGGQTWAKLENVPGVGSIAVTYEPAGKQIYVTTVGNSAGLYTSGDGGKTWKELFKGTLLSIAVSPLNPKHLVIINEKGQVYASRDNGLTWTNE